MERPKQNTYQQRPPERAVKFLNWYCNAAYRDEIEGDLHEQFAQHVLEKGVRQARLRYWINIILFIRSYTVNGKTMNFKPFGDIMLWPSYARVAVRHLNNNKTTGLLNIGGLAIGLACCILALLFVQNETGYDQFHVNKERILRIDTEIGQSGGDLTRLNAVSWPIGRKIREQFPDVEAVLHMRRADGKVTHDNNLFFYTARYAEPEFFDVFTFPLAEGNIQTALSEPFAIVLTESVAATLFPGESALGKTVTMRDSVDFRVSGILPDMPENSHMQLDILVSFETFRSEFPEVDEDAHWLDLNMFNYVLLKDGADAMRFTESVSGLLEEHAGSLLTEYGYTAQLLTTALPDIYLNAEGGNPFGPTGNANTLYLLGLIGLTVLLVATANFVNLSTARAANRSREVGIRKVVGSNRGALVQQFLGESVLTSLAALTVGVCLAWLALPHFNALTDSSLTLAPLMNPSVGTMLIAFAMGVGLLAGIYPALILSGFKPMGVLKGTVATGRSGTAIRRSLVVFQFAISSILIVATVIVYQQVRHMNAVELGFDGEQVVVADARRVGIQEVSQKADLVREALLGYTGLEHVSMTAAVPGTSGWGSIMVIPEGKTQDESLITEFVAVDHYYARTLGLEMVAGRDFDETLGTDTAGKILINEAAVAHFGFNSADEAIGKKVDAPNRRAAGEVVGVVKDYNHHSLHQRVESIIYGLQPFPQYIALRASSAELDGAIAALSETWETHFPGHEFSYFFLDDAFGEQYVAEQRLTKVFFTFAMLAILVSCLGLFGLATYSTMQRRKEIGVRKVMGASSWVITRLLLREILVLVTLAALISAPIAFFAMSGWLDAFAYRIDIGVGAFLLAAIGTIVVAVGTVGYHTAKAATGNPVGSLRSE